MVIIVGVIILTITYCNNSNIVRSICDNTYDHYYTHTDKDTQQLIDGLNAGRATGGPSHAQPHTCMCRHMYVHIMYVYIVYVCVYIYIYIHTGRQTDMQTYRHTDMQICTLYIYIYIYTHISQKSHNLQTSHNSQNSHNQTHCNMTTMMPVSWQSRVQ